MVRSLVIPVAASMALAGFSVAILSGSTGGHQLTTILERSLISALCSFGGGVALGLVLDGVVRRHAQQLRMQMEQTEPESVEPLDPVDPAFEAEARAGMDEPMMTV